MEENDLMKKQCYVLDTLTSMLNFSSENLLTQEMFDALMHPLLKQVRVNFKMLSKNGLIFWLSKCANYCDRKIFHWMVLGKLFVELIYYAYFSQ